jgi:hypothetical protein
VKISERASEGNEYLRPPLIRTDIAIFTSPPTVTT